MRPSVVEGLFCCVLLCVGPVLSHDHAPLSYDQYQYDYSDEQASDEIIAELNMTEFFVNALNVTIRNLAQQLMLQELAIAEKIRSDGYSGVKQVRGVTEGTRPYHSTSQQGNSFLSMHDHANNIRTVGLGEFSAVMNGVDFRTRHNDYRLYMPSTTSSEIHEYDEIPFPDIPPEVLSKPTIDEQVAEMREWFKAWQFDNQNPRDYRKYFKPVMCYLEGAWYYYSDEVIDGESDRHGLNAASYHELFEKVLYTAYTGGKESGENLAFLPRMTYNVSWAGLPQYAQWNYRIMCHPIKHQLYLNRFRPVDDLKGRNIPKLDLDDWANHKAARFSLNVRESKDFDDRQQHQKILETIMREIPGMNNYGAYLLDHGLDGLSVDPDNKSVPLNAGYYHRRHSSGGADASGYQTRLRGYSDPNVFMALTSHKDIIEMYNPTCSNEGKECHADEHFQRWTYAIPLEIVWMTPLNGWNPYNITYKGQAWSEWGKTVTEGGRDGSENKPFNGSSHSNYHVTPSEFFFDDETDPDPADTTPGVVYVLDSTGTKRAVRSSGTRIFFPEIAGIGKLRQRYPVAPVHGEYSAQWMEAEALKDVIFRPESNAHMYYDDVSEGFSPVCSIKGDPRDSLGMMNSWPGSWMNLFISLSFPSSAIVSGVEYYTMRAGTTFVSVWRNTLDKEWQLIGKIQIEGDSQAGVKRKVLPSSEWFKVEKGDAVAIHCSSGSAVVPYELPNGISSEGIYSGALHTVRAVNALDKGWTTGFLLNVTGSEERKSVPIRMLAECSGVCHVYGDPRGGLDMMNTIPGIWTNLFVGLTFEHDAIVTAIEYYSAKAGHGFVSVWRHVGDDVYVMVAKVEIDNDATVGIKTVQLRQGSEFLVKKGDAVAVHYPKSGIAFIPYEKSENDLSPGINVNDFYGVKGLDANDDGWQPGKTLQFDSGVSKRMAAINVLTACMSGCTLSGDPREFVGDLNSSPGIWINLFTEMSFKSRALVTSLEYYAIRSGSAWVSFWRHKEGDVWTMVDKIAINGSAQPSIVTVNLGVGNHVMVERGDIVAIQYSKGGQSIIPYELPDTSLNRTSGLTDDDLHQSYAMDLNDDGSWETGHVINITVKPNPKAVALRVISTCLPDVSMNTTTTSTTTTTTATPTTTQAPLPGCSFQCDPRDELGDMNDRPGDWFNLFEGFTFASDSLVQGLEFYAVKQGDFFLSFWRRNEGTLWSMVDKINVTSSKVGVQEKLLPESEWIGVQQGDALAIHYAQGHQGVIPYELKANSERNATQGITNEHLVNNIAMGALDDGWPVGHVLNVSAGRSQKTLPIKVIADCQQSECRRLHISGMQVADQVWKSGNYKKLSVAEYCHDGKYPTYKHETGNFWFYYWPSAEHWRISNTNCADWSGVKATPTDPTITDPSQFGPEVTWSEYDKDIEADVVNSDISSICVQ